MSCPEKQLLLAYMDNELPKEKSEEITRHIGSCSSCKNFLEAQKLLETVWRDGWKDPVKKDFELMRSAIQNTPVKLWWKMQRTWYVAAALCAVYLGVKIFVIDNSTPSLSQLIINENVSQNETVSPVSSNTQNRPDFERENEATEVCEDLIETSEINPEIQEILYEGGFETVSSSGYVSAEMDDIQADEPTFTEEIVSDNGQLRMHDETIEAEEIEESAATYRLAGDGILTEVDSMNNLDSKQGAIENSVAFSAGSRVNSGIGFGGGSVGSAVVDSPTDEELPSGFEGNTDGVVLAVAQSSSNTEENRDINSVVDSSVQIVFSSGTIASISSAQWPQLYNLLAELLKNNPLFADNSIMLQLDETGSVTGSGVVDGTSLELPDSSYSNCVIHIHF